MMKTVADIFRTSKQLKVIAGNQLTPIEFVEKLMDKFPIDFKGKQTSK